MVGLGGTFAVNGVVAQVEPAKETKKVWPENEEESGVVGGRAEKVGQAGNCRCCWYDRQGGLKNGFCH